MERVQLPGLFGMAPDLFNEADKRLIRSIENFRVLGGAKQATIAVDHRRRAHLEAVLTAYGQYVVKMCGGGIEVCLLIFPEPKMHGAQCRGYLPRGTAHGYVACATASGCPDAAGDLRLQTCSGLRAPPARS